MKIGMTAQVKRTTARLLLSPFWRSMSVRVIEQLNSRPQICDSILELIDMKLEEYVQHTLSYTLPCMIVMKRHDIIDRLVSAVKKISAETNLSSMIMKNLPAILGILLLHDAPDIERFTMRV